VTGEVSFLWEKAVLQKLLSDERIDFEYVRLSGLIIDPAEGQSVITQRFEQLDVDWLGQAHALAFAHMPHFEGIDLLGSPDVLAKAIARLEERFEIRRHG